MTQKEKTKFRSTPKWKKFRLFMKNKQQVDAVTKKCLYKGWNLHHLDERHYDDLNPEKFACLNRMTHDVVHWLERYDNYEEICQNLITLIRKMKEYKECE